MTTRRSWRSGSSRSGTSWQPSFCRRAFQCCPRATRWAGARGGNNNALLSGQRDQLGAMELVARAAGFRQLRQVHDHGAESAARLEAPRVLPGPAPSGWRSQGHHMVRAKAVPRCPTRRGNASSMRGLGVRASGDRDRRDGREWRSHHRGHVVPDVQRAPRSDAVRPCRGSSRRSPGKQCWTRR